MSLKTNPSHLRPGRLRVSAHFCIARVLNERSVLLVAQRRLDEDFHGIRTGFSRAVSVGAGGPAACADRRSGCLRQNPCGNDRRRVLLRRILCGSRANEQFVVFVRTVSGLATAIPMFLVALNGLLRLNFESRQAGCRRKSCLLRRHFLLTLASKDESACTTPMMQCSFCVSQNSRSNRCHVPQTRTHEPRWGLAAT